MIPVFVSLGQSKNPVKRKLEEAIVSELEKLAAFDVVVIPNLYDLSAKGESMTALQQVTGDMLVFSWLYQRSTHWILDRNGIHGKLGEVQLQSDDPDDEEDSAPDDNDEADEVARVIDQRPPSDRTIYCLDLRVADTAADFNKQHDFKDRNADKSGEKDNSHACSFRLNCLSTL